MDAIISARGLTAADLKDNLHDIQDNVVAPILMRYGRHMFFKFSDGAKARAWLRKMFKRVNARSARAWDAIHRQYRIHLPRAEGARVSPAVARQLPRGVPGGHARPRPSRRRRRTARAGTLGGRPRRSRHSRHGIGSHRLRAEGREEATQIIRAEMEATGGVEIRFVQDTMALAHENGIGSEGEHFGFADPISQPPIEGADAPSYPGDGVLEPDGTWRPLKPGEFLLGYEDEAGPDGVAGARAVRAAAERNLHGVPQALSGRGGVSPVSGDRREGALRLRRPVSPGAGRGQDDGALAQRLPGRSFARQGRSRDRGGPSAPQQLHLCRRRRGPAVPTRLAPASHQSARDAIETRDRGEAAPADPPRRGVRPASAGGRRSRTTASIVA